MLLKIQHTQKSARTNEGKKEQKIYLNQKQTGFLMGSGIFFSFATLRHEH